MKIIVPREIGNVVYYTECRSIVKGVISSIEINIDKGSTVVYYYVYEKARRNVPFYQPKAFKQDEIFSTVDGARDYIIKNISLEKGV